MKVLVIAGALTGALLLAAAGRAEIVDCSLRYMAVSDELGQAEDNIPSYSDMLYQPVHQLHNMVRAKLLGARMGTHCSAVELQQLDTIEAALFRKGLARTKEQLEAEQRAKDKAAWDAALAQFSKNIETLVASKDPP